MCRWIAPLLLGAAVVAQVPRETRTLSGHALGAGENERVRVAVWHGDVGAKDYEKVGEVLAAPDGSFEIAGVPRFVRGEWGWHKLQLIARSSRQIGLYRIPHSGAPVADIAIVMRPQRTVHGRFVEAVTGEPVSGVRVWPEILFEGDRIDHWIAGPVEPWPVESDRDGRFELRGLPSGYRIQALACGPEHATAWVDIQPDRDRVAVELQTGGRLVGRVRMPDGAPAANVQVVAEGKGTNGKGYARATTDEEGRFELRSLEGCNWNVRAVHGELTCDEVVGVVPVPGEAVACADVQLLVGGVVVGRILDAEGKGPLDPGEQAMVLSYGPKRGGSCRGVAVETDGTFRLVLPEGRSRIYLTGAPDYEKEEWVTVEQGREVEVAWKLRGSEKPRNPRHRRSSTRRWMAGPPAPTIPRPMSEPAAKPAVQDGLAFERPLKDLQTKIDELRNLNSGSHLELQGEIDLLEERLKRQTEEVYAGLSPWERVNVARHADRPLTQDYITTMLDDFVELHGDRMFGDDRAIVCGLATMGEHQFLLVGHRKGKTVKDRLACNFGCAHPEGYRKALQKMQLAQKLKLPIVTFINTPGAYPGIGAEERGQASAIARNILEMFGLEVPIISLVIGEGGSGGALGIGVGDRVGMLENSYYSVISPEGCAAILWKSGEKAPEAAEALKLTSNHLLRLGLVDKVIAEPLGGAHKDPKGTIENVRAQIGEWLTELKALPVAELLEQRYRKFRGMGVPIEL